MYTKVTFFRNLYDRCNNRIVHIIGNINSSSCPCLHVDRIINIVWYCLRSVFNSRIIENTGCYAGTEIFTIAAFYVGKQSLHKSFYRTSRKESHVINQRTVNLFGTVLGLFHKFEADTVLVAPGYSVLVEARNGAM